MKKNIISAVVLLAVAALATSCAKELQPNNSTPGGNVTFTGVIDQFGEGTKTVLNSSHQVEWESSDELRINDGFFSVAPKSDATAATFTFNGEGTEPTTGPYTAYYPKTLYDGTKLTLPETQIYTAGKITNNPMYAYSETSSLSFHNLCGLVEFTLKGTATISKIIVTTNAGGLSGDFTVNSSNVAVLTDDAKAANKGVTLDCGAGVTLNNDPGVKFWIAIPEGTYTLTFTAIDTEGKVFQKVTTAGVNVVANNIYAFTQFPTFTGSSYLCFTASEADATVTLNKNGNPTTNALEYQTIIGGNASTWTDLSYGTALPTLPSVNDKVYIRAKEARTTSQTTSDYVHFTADKDVKVSGNIMYLVDPTGTSTTISREAEFYSLFASCTHLIEANDLVLPAMTLAPACYANMFYGCSNLTAAPALPARTLAQNCYGSMFQNCSKLTAAPVLPAPTLVQQCYSFMFKNCTLLTSIACFATDISATNCTVDWVFGVTATGTFKKVSGPSWAIDYKGIPSSFTAVDVIPGVFSVSDKKKVFFSKGNLYWDGSKFEFEGYQYLYASDWDASHVSHFYWSKTASVAYASSYSDTGDASDVLFTNATATTPKSDFTAGGTTGVWRALSFGERDHLFFERIVNGGKKEGKSYQRATINSDAVGVYGMILYPDGYTAQTSATNYDSATWTTMETAGCVFLPGAGYRTSGGFSGVGAGGSYWSSSAYNESESYSLLYDGSGVISINDTRYYGYSVRLVAD